VLPVPERRAAGWICVVVSALSILSAVALFAEEPAAAKIPAPFVDATASSGLDFVHWNGMTGRRTFLEMMGSGGALFDMDGDGDLDLFAAQGSALDPQAKSIFPPPAEPGGRLFRNLLSETGHLHFEDVTAKSGIASKIYGMGAAIGDVDGDGLPDLYLTGFGEPELWRNLGQGRFAEVAAKSGLGTKAGAKTPWSVPALFFDADADGDDDLYVGEYVEYSPADDKPCFLAGGAADYCGPIAYKSAKDHLYRNRGDGTFEDISTSSKIGTEAGAALGAIAFDADGDGKLDLYVANDGQPNFLWRNLGGGQFENIALLAGCAVNASGLAEASMGVDAADVDGDGDDDLLMTHLSQETNTFYRNQGEGFFEDETAQTGLGPASFPFTSFGVRWLDFDLDGDLDVITVSGTIRTIEAQLLAKEPHPLRQRPQLFRNDGGHFTEVLPAELSLLAKEFVGRGLVAGDVDNDGDLDLVLFANAGPLVLWLGQAAQEKNWIGFEVVGQAGRPAPAARVALVFADGQRAWQRVRRDGSYLSSHDPRLLFGLGGGQRIAKIEVTFGAGRVETWSALEPGRYHLLLEGQGKKP